MIKHIQAIRRLLPTNCLSGFDHFVELAIKVLSFTFPWLKYSGNFPQFVTLLFFWTIVNNYFGAYSESKFAFIIVTITSDLLSVYLVPLQVLHFTFAIGVNFKTVRLAYVRVRGFPVNDNWDFFRYYTSKLV